MPASNRNERKDWKAISWDYDYILSFSDDVECPYLLTEREIQALLTFMDTMGWKTRWESKLDTPIDKDVIVSLRDKIIDKLMRDEDCPSDPCEDGCIDYLPNSSFIRYEPNDPFRTPDLLPDGYTYIPWYTNPGIPLPGVISTDAMVNQLAVLSPSLPVSGFPRFSFEFDGRGEIEIELVNVPAGGFCIIVLDENPFDIKVVNTSSNLLDMLSIAGILAALGFDTEDANLVDTDIIEIDVEDVGHHRIDVTFLPNIGGETIIGYGGGLRRVTLCGPVQVVEEMYLQRANPEYPCLIEQSTDGGITWQEAWRMDNCCDDEPIGTRINDDGYQEVTYDGEAWEIDKTGDTRFTNPTMPPIPGANDETRCAAANSIVRTLETKQGDDLEKKTTGATTVDFITALVGFLVAAGVVTGGVTALLAVITSAIAAFVVHILTAEFEAAFDGTTWDELLCILYCNMDDDGGISEAQWLTIQDLVTSEIGDYAGSWIRQHIQALGPVGLTNTARQRVAGSRDCDGCDCEETWCYVWDFPTGGDGEWTVVTEAGYDLGEYISSVGWQHTDHLVTTTDPDSAYRAVVIKRVFTSSTVTRMVVTYEFEKGSYNAPSSRGIFLSDGVFGGSEVDFSNQAFNVMTEGPNVTHEWNGSRVMTRVNVFIRSSQDDSAPRGYSGTVIIKSIQMEGVGTNPFGSDNC